MNRLKMAVGAACALSVSTLVPVTSFATEATGGDVSAIGSCRVHTFHSDGTFTVTEAGRVDLLVVGGGGGGGRSCGGGGGGGGVLILRDVDVAPGDYKIVVGCGGSGATGDAAATNGGESKFGEVAVHGGGAGGSSNNDGQAGASGGGAGGAASGKPEGQYYNGGAAEFDGHGGGASSVYGGSNQNQVCGGGGGGAGGPGHDGAVTDPDGTCGFGGAGVFCDFSGTPMAYGGGGGAGCGSLFSSRHGVDGGGNGGTSSELPGVGATGVGGGGGGGGRNGWSGGDGGAGGNGIVIVRYEQDFTVPFKTAEGGDEVRMEGEYEIHSFYQNGTFRVTGDSYVEVLVVGGGGGGGNGVMSGGGGGGGAVVHTNLFILREGDYPIVVGAGGVGASTTGANWNSTPATDGEPSSAFGLVAAGGGRGAQSNAEGADGASGGGAGAHDPGSWGTQKRLAGGKGMNALGHDGGASTNESTTVAVSGGGGGAGTCGGDATIPPTGLSGRGGDGVACSITGRAVFYGGGGGGGMAYDCGQADERAEGTVAGGKGGGGCGSGRGTRGASQNVPFAGQDAVPHSGGGGGGASGKSPVTANAGSGGSGIVVVRCKAVNAGLRPVESELASGGKVTRRPGYFIHTFDDDGSFVAANRMTVDLLVVGGGGGGGSNCGGGGGGGGVLVVSNLLLEAGSYAVNVGNGGSEGVTGEPSRFGLYVAPGGGGGGSGNKTGLRGASGGGAGGPTASQKAGTFFLGGLARECFGGNGGLSSVYEGSNQNQVCGGGGGGAGGPGHDGAVTDTDGTCGFGGAGVFCDFSGTPMAYGGGGGAGNGSLFSSRQGVDGGGNGGTFRSASRNGTAATAGRGGGGGGGGRDGYSVGTGGAGGKGVIIVRYHRPKTGCVIILR